MPIDFRVWYIRPTPNGTGSLGLYPPDLRRLEAWRHQNGHKAVWWFAYHPTTGQRLHGFTPVAANQCARIEAQGIRPGDLCTVTYETKIVGGRPQMWFVSAAPLPPQAPATHPAAGTAP
jgi:hypothetical protein